jgi:hypothetical protein
VSRPFPDPTPDLFGEMTAAPMPAAIGEKKRRVTQPKGYAAPPGTGPKGETCRTCIHKYTRQMGGSYIKCLLVKARWTGGPGTDIKASAPACRYWDGGIGHAYVCYIGKEIRPRPQRVLVISASESKIDTTFGEFTKHTDGTWRWHISATSTWVSDCVLERVTLKEGAAK